MSVSRRVIHHGLAFAVLANNKLRYFVILSQQKQEGRGGAANTCNAW